MTKLEELVAEFARHVQAQTEAIWRGDAKTGNKHADQSWTAFEKLRAHGDAGRNALAVLFTHPRMDVRVSAAALLLRHRTTEAKAVLEEAAKGEGLVPFEASQALKRWEDGTWALDPAENAMGPPEALRPAPPRRRTRPRTEHAATDRRRGSASPSLPDVAKSTAYCVFCLARPATEDEHVMPKGWYPSTTPPAVQRVTVPVCGICADEFEKAERAFAHPLLMAISPDHPDAVGVAQAYRRSWQFDQASTARDARHRAGRLKKIAREMKFVLTPTDGRVYPRVMGRTAGGLYVSSSPAIEMDPTARKRIAEKLVRGFHFDECGEPLPLTADIGFFWGKDLEANMRAEFAKLPINERLAPGLRYRVWREGVHAVWLFLLWGQIEFGALVRMPENHFEAG